MNRPLAPRLPFALLWTLLWLLSGAPAAPAGELELQTGLGLGSEYNDNVGETSRNKKTDFINHVKPKITLDYTGGRISGNLDYRGNYRFHVMGKETDEYSHYLKAGLLGEVIENLFYLRIDESLTPVYGTASRGDVVEGDTTLDMVNRNRFEVSPYFSLWPTDRTNLSFGYGFSDLRYSESERASGSSFLPDFNNDYNFDTNTSRQHRVFMDASHEATDRFTAYTGVDAVRWDGEKNQDGTDPSFTRYQAYVGGRYEISEDLVVSLRVGPSYTIPKQGGDNKLWPYLMGDAIWTVGRSEFGLAASMDYTDDPATGISTRRTSYKGWWNKNFDRSHLTVDVAYNSYDRDQDTRRIGTDNSDDKSYRIGAHYTYELTERLRLIAGTTLSLSTDYPDGNNWYYGNAGLRYELSEDSQVSLTYRYKQSDSEDNADYSVNRVILEFSTLF